MKKTPKDELLDYKNIYKTKKTKKVKEDGLKTSITYFWYIHKVKRYYWDIYNVRTKDIFETFTRYKRRLWDIHTRYKLNIWGVH